MNMEARIRGIGMTSVRTRKRLVARLREQGIYNEDVLNAFIEMPRHMFVDEAMESRAYEDCSLPIGEGQTISQPYIVALMTQLLLESRVVDKDSAPAKVLEIGSGSGFQAAVLSMFVDKVYTVERVRTLAHRCSRKFAQMGIRNVSSRYTDGFDGWVAEAPFDAIMVTAAMSQVPRELIDQLRPGGVLIGPIGCRSDSPRADSTQAGSQQLSVIRLRDDGRLQTQQIAPVFFVPFLAGLC